jgi:beta-galactosidase
MFSGGTNFGFHNGSNYADRIQPTITSYDYDAPLGETGEVTAKYRAFRSVIAKYAPIPEGDLPAPRKRIGYGDVALSEAARLFDVLDTAATDAVQSTVPLTMEEIGQSFGFLLYRSHLTGPREELVLHLQEVHDRALVFLDGEYLGTVERDEGSDVRVALTACETATIDVLVENLGRINYGPRLADRKGITEGIRLGNQFLYHWEHRPLPLAHLPDVAYTSTAEGKTTACPAFFRGSFQVDAAADTFLSFDGWSKGVCFINGFNLGRYWDVGPQKTLYVPGALLKTGANEIVLFELYGWKSGARPPSVLLTDTPDLG